MIGAAAFSSACASRQAYSPPVIDVPSAFREDANWKQARPADEAARGKWWEVFGDTALDRLEDQI
ncbi:MAG TPA: hypothetical protein VG871_20645, partial [Vicinamibacterales bacterium]|nr:hypothetical protein [Vicinamibacterales bacterium]